MILIAHLRLIDINKTHNVMALRASSEIESVRWIVRDAAWLLRLPVGREVVWGSGAGVRGKTKERFQTHQSEWRRSIELKCQSSDHGRHGDALPRVSGISYHRG